MFEQKGNMILAQKIAEQRKKNGWSQEELAEKLSVSRQSVSKWESAQSVPDLNRILKLAEIFGVTTDYLLKDEIETIQNVVDFETADNEKNVRKVTMEEADEFIHYRKKTAPVIESVMRVYWLIFVAIYLAASFLTGRWDITWVVWPVAGVLCPVVQSVTKMIVR